MNVKERRIDLRMRLANHDPIEVDKICEVNTAERQKEMKKRMQAFQETKPSFTEKEMVLLASHFPEMLAEAHKAEDIMDAQAIRWVHDECSPVAWLGSDADMAVEYYLSKLLDMKDALAFC